jgi:hypothetical protein
VTSKSSRALVVLNHLLPTITTYGIVTREHVEDVIEECGFKDYLTVFDMGRFMRVQTGEEYTACDINHVPCVISRNEVALFAHPSKVKRPFNHRYISWMSSIIGSWQAKNDKFREQMGE